MPQCKAKANSTGKRCQRSAIAGATVCRVHGGAAPQVKRKAQERLAALVDPAIDCLDRTIKGMPAKDEKGKPIQDDPTPAVSLSAARDALDRAGHKPQENLNLTGSIDLIERLQAGRRRLAEHPED